MATTKKTTVKKTTAKKTAPKKKVEVPQHIGLVRNDSWLEPFEDAIRGRHDHALWKISQLTKNGKQKLTDFASGHFYFGLHKLAKGWVFREWAPNATEIYLIGDFNNWQENEKFKCKRIEGTGNWELKLSEKAIKHGQLYKMKVKWNGEKVSVFLLVPSCRSGRPDQDILCSSMESRAALCMEKEELQAQQEPLADL